MQVEIKDIPEMRVAAIRHIGPYMGIGEAFAKLGEIAGRAGLFRDGARMLGIFYDDAESTPAHELRSDAALTISADAPLPEGADERRIPAGRYATTTHVGPYEGLADTWSRLTKEWLPSSAHVAGDGVSFEIYRNTPGAVPPEKLLTDMYVPLSR